MRVAVGCPIRNRAWIFEEWVDHVRIAFDLAGVKPEWVFNIGLDPGGRDDGTHRIVTELFRHESGVWGEDTEPAVHGHRSWTPARYEDMVRYRNKLLHLVRAIKPDYFLSLDSDILLHPSALVCLLETIQRKHNIQGYEAHFDAVGGKAFLSEVSRHYTTYGSLGPNGGGIRRQDADGVFPVEIIMAIKLMNPAAYSIPYEFNTFGEDIGWSLNCNKAGLKLGWDGRVISKHIMNKEKLNTHDNRVGW